MRRPLALLLSAATCALLSFLSPVGDPDSMLDREAARMQVRVNERADLLERSVASAEAWLDQHDPGERFAEDLPEGFQAAAFLDDSLIAWGGDLAIDEDSIRTMPHGHGRSGNSVFLHAERHDGAFAVHALAEVWSAPPFQNAYLKPLFAPELHAPEGLVAAAGPGIGPVVRDPNGEVMFRLAWSENASPLFASDWIQLLLRAIAIVLLVGACWAACRRIADRGKPWTGVLAFALLIVVLRYASLLLYPIAPFDHLALFGPELYAASSWLPSLGDLLIDALLLLVVARFIHIALREAYIPNGKRALLPGVLASAVVLSSAWWITSAFIGLVEDSSVDLDLFHLQDLNVYSVLALVCVAALFAGWTILCDALAKLFVPSRSFRDIAIVLGAALVVSTFLHDVSGVVDMILVLWPVPVLVTVLHGRARGYRLAHALVGLAALSFLGAHVLIKYTLRRENHERLALAERLVTNDDPVVELLFREAAPRLRADAGVYALLNDTTPCIAADLDALVRQSYFSGYWERYDVRLYAFGPDGKERCSTSPEPPRSLASDDGRFITTVAVADMPELFRDASPGERTFYHARVAVMASDTSRPAQLIIELHPRIAPEGQGFPELLLNDAGGLARRLDRYAFARYDGGTLMESRGFAFPLQWTEAMEPDGSAHGELDGHDLLAYGDPQRSLVVLAAPSFTWWDRATTFCWLFAFFSLMLTLAFGMRAMRHWNGGPSLGIGGKVRVALLVFAALGLVFFSLGSQRLLSRLYGERSDAALLEKSRSLLVELRQKLEGEGSLGADRIGYLNHLLGRFSNVFFTDVNLYAPNGRLLATSRPQVFDAGLLGRRMNATAFAHMATNGRSEFVQVEHIGSARFRSAYMPLRNKRGQLLAYINLPSFARQGELDRERGTLLTAIVNLFVLLLALSLLAGVFISGWTTRPLELLKRGLSRIALQGANVPLAYRGRDEVGELVKVYNRKVEELRESAERLARSERESAWKEMARQVAHEITNPLTPMRLSVQHFERTWDASAPDAQERMARFTSGMVEQIDALSRIAGEFSAFAQMPQPQETVFDLRKVAEAATALFTGEENADIRLVANEPLMVKADREHLLRALNNLLKNALQAIPEGRRGRVDVTLQRDGDRAIISVRDNGSGIPEEARERIFTPSFTTKSSGMGLGLAMVKRIVEQSGGSVTFDTSTALGVADESEGTTFRITLPLYDLSR